MAKINTPFGQSEIKRVVVKVGTNLLRGDQEGLDLVFITGLARQIAEIHDRKMEVILVSSGAVGAGAYVMDFETPPGEISVRQALAAIGQSRLMHHYKAAFLKEGLKVAQVLLTRDDLDSRQRYLHVRNAMEQLLDWRVVPIVNENDTVAIEELGFSDNDQLAALIAGKIDADLLLLLTNVDGIFDRPPGKPGAARMRLLPFRDYSGVELGEIETGSFGLGGIKGKLKAVRMATRAGILTHVGSGKTPEVLLRVLAGDDSAGTWCEPSKRRISARKRWLALGKRMADGVIRVDEGAEKALRMEGKSLLPSGIVGMDGTFERGDLVRIMGREKDEIAWGLVRYSSIELARIAGKRTVEVIPVLGRRPNYEVIHRDDLVLMAEGLDDDCAG